MLPVEVPAHTHDAPRVVEHIRVAPGTNWDFSRSAVVTPITPLVDPPPAAPPAPAPVPKPTQSAEQLAPYQQLSGIPTTAPLLTLHFYTNSAAVSPHVRSELRRLKKGAKFIVVSYPQHGDLSPERVCKARARVITAILRASGHKVIEIKALGRATVTASAPFVKTDSVEIFTAPVG